MNLPDLLAAIGTVQLAKCRRLSEERLAIAEAYNQAFETVDELELPPQANTGDEHAWHLYILRICPERLTITRNEFIAELKAASIGTSVHFIPLHLHPYYREHGYESARFPGAEDAYRRCISLPIFPGMTSAEVSRVTDSVKLIAARHRIHKAAA
jgi:perosamine synthetase